MNICSVSGRNFVIEAQEKAMCERLGIPLPRTHPEERLRRLMGFRNEWKLYRRTCDASGQSIISAYPSSAPFPVYANSVWWGDSWDARDFGQEFDFSRPFFDQFKALQGRVPREGTSIFNSENCDFNSHIRQSRNCYLNSLVAKSEDMHYSYWMVGDKDVVDCAYTSDSTLCYYGTDLINCYNCVMVAEMSDCSDCAFSYELRGCNHCLFSSNLVNKSYYAFNRPCSAEEFRRLWEQAFDGRYATWRKNVELYEQVRANAIHQGFHSLKSENSSGDHVYNCKNCRRCFDSFGSEDCYNSISSADSKDIFNSYSAGWQRCEAVYECCVSRGCTDIAFCTYSWFSQNLFYCDGCVSTKDSIGCIGLRHKEYCILNRQYSREEYVTLRGRIIDHMKKTGEWGQFFPPDLSPYAYNETAAQDFFPLTNREALSLGWRWREEDAREFAPQTISGFADNICEESSDITKAILACSACGKNYRIIPYEFDFLRRIGVPIPRECSTCRHAWRMRLRNEPMLNNRTCSRCGIDILSTYGELRSEKIYCEACYRQTVY